MTSSRHAQVRGIGYGIAAALLLLLAMPFKVSTAQDQGQGEHVAYAKFACSDQTVKVVPDNGTDPKAIYLCAGNKVTWDPNGHSFFVYFKKSPFVDGRKTFDEKHTQSAAAKNDTVLTVYNYVIFVDGELVEDPQIVGGGGHSN